MGYFTEKKTGILITALIGFIFVVVGLLSLIGFIEDSSSKTQAIFGVLFGLFLIYPLFKK